MILADLDTQTRLWAAALGGPGESLLRLALAAVAGGLIGLEREIRGRQAGFRTMMLVCVGCALAMLVSIEFAHRRWMPGAGSTFNINVDPARIAYSVMTGVGFLGAGTIIKHEASVRGLTTAAAMWCVAAIGLASGLGMYVVAIFAMLITLAALWLLDLVEEALPKVRYRTVVLRRPWRDGCIDQTVARLRAAHLTVAEVNFDRRRDPSVVDIEVRIAFRDKAILAQLERELQQDPECQLVATDVW